MCLRLLCWGPGRRCVLRLLVFFPSLQVSALILLMYGERRDRPRLLLRKPEISRLIGLGAETDVLVMTANEFVAEGLQT
jgi:hypothetical protein